MSEGMAIAAVILAAGIFAGFRLFRLARGKRPDCCSGGDRAQKRRP
ncbi:MAG: hypothetical protein LBC88_07000 [Spirochaetaceae bacterium]|jgi:hypothetical protein|nr:hypothetical protein [Spirochaetaceae bacterium]